MHRLQFLSRVQMMKITDDDTRVWIFSAEPKPESKLAKEIAILLACFCGAALWCLGYWAFILFLTWIGK